MNELILLESRTLRDEVVVKTGVLEKVKFLRLLPDNQHATTEMVANFYEVPENTVRQTLVRHKAELESDGIKTLTRRELSDMLSLSSWKLTENGYTGRYANKIVLFPRRAILRVGMLLRDSEVAKQVRTYLLDAEHVTTAKDIEKLAAEKELLEQKYHLRQVEVELERIAFERERMAAEKEKFTRLLAFVEKYALPTEYQRAIISRLAGLEIEPVKKHWSTEELAAEFTFKHKEKITAKRLAMLARAGGIRPNKEAGEMENGYAVVSIAPAVNPKTGRVIEGKIVEQILYNEKGKIVLEELVKEWLLNKKKAAR